MFSFENGLWLLRYAGRPTPKMIKRWSRKTATNVKYWPHKLKKGERWERELANDYHCFCNFVVFKVINFYWVGVGLVSKEFVTIFVEISAPVRQEFCSQEFPDTQTDRHTHWHTDKLQWKYNPSTISWRCNKSCKNNPIKITLVIMIC